MPKSVGIRLDEGFLLELDKMSRNEGTDSASKDFLPKILQKIADSGVSISV